MSMGKIYNVNMVSNLMYAFNSILMYEKKSKTSILVFIVVTQLNI